MPLPTINITFRTAAVTASRRAGQGTVAVIIKDSAELDAPYFELMSSSEIPANLGVANKSYLERAFLGNENAPRKVLVYMLPTDAAEYTDALTELAKHSFDWLVGDPACDADGAEEIKAWILDQRENHDKTYKAVLPNIAADSEAIVNFVAEGIMVDGTTYAAAAYCSRIAGLIAGTPLRMSATYVPLTEVSDINRKTRAELDAEVEAGKFVLLHDGVKVKTGRAVTSLVNGDVSAQLKKIKIVEAQDLIKSDLKLLFEDNYLGKYANSYDNKCLLVTATHEYLRALEQEDILESGTSAVSIDLNAQKAYLKAKGENVADMTEKEIKEANTDEKVFLTAGIRVLDAIEDIQLPIEF